MLAHVLIQPLVHPLAFSLAVNRFKAFDPLSLSPAMWLDASDATTLYDAVSGGAVVAGNGAVARWQDKSGNALHATQATLGARPLRQAAMLNGKPVLRFDGVDDMMGHGLNAVGDSMTFMVVRSYQTGNELRTLFSACAPNTGLGAYIETERTSGGLWGAFRAQGFLSSGQSLRGGYYIISTTSLNSACSVTHNGVRVDFPGTTHYSDSNDRRFVGGSPGAFTNCDIAEILVFPTALSPTDRTAVETYLNAKWACY